MLHSIASRCCFGGLRIASAAPRLCFTLLLRMFASGRCFGLLLPLALALLLRIASCYSPTRVANWKHLFPAMLSPYAVFSFLFQHVKTITNVTIVDLRVWPVCARQERRERYTSESPRALSVRSDDRSSYGPIALSLVALAAPALQAVVSSFSISMAIAAATIHVRNKATSA